MGSNTVKCVIATSLVIKTSGTKEDGWRVKYFYWIRHDNWLMMAGLSCHWVSWIKRKINNKTKQTNKNKAKQQQQQKYTRNKKQNNAIQNRKQRQGKIKAPFTTQSKKKTK